MKKFTQIFEAAGKYDKKSVESFIKKHDEIDVITTIGQRLFIPSYMHTKGKIEGADDRGLVALLQDGTKMYVPYDSIKKLEF
jgi:hypothetical protein